jgi:hypothetical protein
MHLDRSAPALRPLAALLREHHWRALDAAIGAAARTGTGDAGVNAYLRDLHLPERDRLLLTLAYSLVRGFGPAVQIHELWGMEREGALAVLAGLAQAMDPEGAASLLREAAALLEAGAPSPEG